MIIKGIIFDMDGLMFDTERLGYNYMMKITSLNGYVMPESVLNKTIGVNKKTAIRIFKKYLGNDFPVEKLLKEKRKIVNDNLDKNGVPIKEGLLELLQYLEENNIKKAVATSSYRVVAEKVLKLAGVYERFDVIVCGDEIKNSKPEPDVFLKAQVNLKILKKNILILEDSPMGVLAAYRAGIKSVMIPDILSSDERTKSMYFKECKSLKDVISILDSLNK